MKPYKGNLDKLRRQNPNALDPLTILETKIHDSVLYYANTPDNDGKLYAAIAAYADNICFNFDYLKKYIEYYNQNALKDKLKKYPFNIPTEIEFLKILEFRESEMRRVLQGGEHTWQWPAEWGDVGWNSPVFHNPVRYSDFMNELDKNEREKIEDRLDIDFALDELRNTQKGILILKSQLGMSKETVFL